jgi:hypothetical protein
MMRGGDRVGVYWMVYLTVELVAEPKNRVLVMTTVRSDVVFESPVPRTWQLRFDSPVSSGRRRFRRSIGRIGLHTT